MRTHNESSATKKQLHSLVKIEREKRQDRIRVNLTQNNDEDDGNHNRVDHPWAGERNDKMQKETEKT